MRWYRSSGAAPAAAACAVLAALALVAAGCGRGDETAAEVAGVRYTVAELHDHLGTTDDNPAVERGDAAEWISRWVLLTAVEMEMADRGVAVTAAHSVSAAIDLTAGDSSFKHDFPGRSLRIHQHAVFLAALEWSGAKADEEVPAALRYLCSSHILVATQAEADQVLERFEAGEPFDALAVELSLDPGSGSVGGELGCVLEGTFVASFEDAAYSAEPGGLVMAESQFGFHVIAVESLGPATSASHPQLDAARVAQMSAEAEQAAGLRRAHKQNEIMNDLQAATVERYAEHVTVHERYGYWDPVGFRVVLEIPA